MAEKLEDLNLPNASVQKIIKETLPDNVIVGKDARSALSRAASVFVLYITSQASKEAQKADRKTLTDQDVITALEELEFDHFVEPLQTLLKEYRDSKHKKEKVNKSKQSNGVENGTVDEAEEDDEVEEQ